MTVCIEWPNYRDANGYGRLGSGRYAHRVVWQHHHGPIPEGMEVRHRCDNPPCINIEHLELGTHADNMRDLAERGRAPRGVLHPAAKLTDDDRHSIRQRFLDGERVCVIERDYPHVSHALVSMIANGKRWSP